MAKGSTNAGGRAEEMRQIDTSKVPLSNQNKEETGGKIETLEEFISMAAQDLASLWKTSELSTIIFEEYGVPNGPFTNEVLFSQLVKKIIPDTAEISEEVLLMYNLAEADINKMFAVILQETIPNAIQEAIGDAMGGEY